MRHDEYNDVKVNNEKSYSKREFGSTPQNEFRFYRDNKNVKSNINETSSINEKVEKNCLIHPTYRKKEFKFNRTVAKVSSSVVTAVSTIAVVSVASVVGLQVVTETKATCYFEHFYISDHFLSYNLMLENVEEDERFVIVVENDNYYKSLELYPGMNEGSFEELVPDQRYDIYVVEDRFGGKKILSQQFTMRPISLVYGAFIEPYVNLENNTFTLYLSYEDFDDIFSDFSLYMEDNDNPNNHHEYTLDKGNDMYELPLSNENEEYSFGPGGTYNYTLSYKNDGQLITMRTESVTFTLDQQNYSSFDGITFDQTANFRDHYFEVTLNYNDPNDTYTAFNFYLEDAYNTDLNYTYSLDKVTTAQILPTNIADADVSFDLLHGTFNYRFTYIENGVEVDYSSDNYFTFTDNSNATSEVNAFIFDQKADFELQQFDVRLDYIDELGVLSDFTLVLTDKSDSTRTQTFILDKKPEVQTLQVDEDPTSGYVLDLLHGEFTYELSYQYDGTTVVYERGDASFENVMTSTFTGITSDYIFPQSKSLLPLKLDYDDGGGIYSNPRLVVKDEEGNDCGEVTLTLTNDYQYADFSTTTVASDLTKSYDLSVTVDVFDIKTETTTSSELYTTSTTFSSPTTSKFYGIYVEEFRIIDMDTFRFIPIYINGNNNITDTKLVIETSDSERYIFDMSLPSEEGYETDISMSSSENENFDYDVFLEKLSNPVKIYVRYSDDFVQDKEMSCYEDVIISHD